VETALWRSTPLEQLVAKQSIRPIADIVALNTMFPTGDIFDDALSELLAYRADRRRRSQEPGNPP
jgi:hypothetical protein